MSDFSSKDNIALMQKPSDSRITIKETPENEIYDVYQLEKCISWITENNYKRTCLQLPDERLNDGVMIAMHLEKIFERTFYILADTAYGSCCVDCISAEHVNGDSIIHFGHACLSMFTKLPVLYIFEKERLDILKFKNILENTFPEKSNITLFYSDVYHHLYEELCGVFENSNVDVSKLVLSEDKLADSDDYKLLYGRIFKVPTETSTAVFLGKDCITLQNLVLALSDTRWYYYTKNEELVEYKSNMSKFLMKKYHLMEIVKDANVIGILVGTLGIDNYLKAIDRVKYLAKNHGKKCYIFAVGRLNVCKLANFPEVDVFVSISCTENVSKDFKEYYKPIVTLFEVEMALGKNLFSTQYLNDFREILIKYSNSSDTEVSEECEVSLTSGKIRSHTKLDFSESSALQEKTANAVVEAKGAEFLAGRSWRGLEQNLENKEISTVKIGRSGIAQGYTNEFATLDKGS